MPRNKDLKRIIRKRMTRTGESYTAARSHIISKPPVKQSPARAIGHATLAGMSDGKIAEKTGRTWAEWMRTLDEEGASVMPHREIARLVHARHGIGDWWAQTVTVGYERIKGLREIGQRRDGGYEVNKSKTFTVPVATLFGAWAEEASRRRWLSGVNTTVRAARPPKSIRLQWPDGTVVMAMFSAKGNAKSAVAVTHTKLGDRAAADSLKTYWSERLDSLAIMMVGTTR
jgi:hypothetical protein